MQVASDKIRRQRKVAALITISLQYRLFLFWFGSSIIELNVSYLCDFLWILSPSLQHLNLLVDIGRVHPPCFVPTPGSFTHLGQQCLTLKWSN